MPEMPAPMTTRSPSSSSDPPRLFGTRDGFERGDVAAGLLCALGHCVQHGHAGERGSRYGVKAERLEFDDLLGELAEGRLRDALRLAVIDNFDRLDSVAGKVRLHGNIALLAE